jgi:outer membrane protein TolC
MTSFRTLGALSAALLLAGCQTGPDYQKPEQALVPYHTAVAKAEAAPPLDRWWTGFHDPELASIVDRALTQNLDLAASVARVQQARAVAVRRAADLCGALPSITRWAAWHDREAFPRL